MATEAMKCGARTTAAEEDIEETEFDKRVHEEARGIIDRGEAYKYIYSVWQKRVKGNQYLGKSLLISRGVQACTNTKGVHILAHGRHGQGKSHGTETMVELLPPSHVKDGDISPKVLYYMQGKILPGTTIAIDDLNLGNDLAMLFKRMTTRFQNGAEQRVVIDGKALELKLPPRLAIWTNSVDLQGDEQLRDRFLDIPIDEGQVDAIIAFMKEADKAPQNDEERVFETAVCREIFSDLVSKSFHVEIPFTDEFTFSKTEMTRGYAIFSDLIKGLAALRYVKRETNEQGHILAGPADFHDAKALYEGLMGHSEEKYTTAEQEVLQAIIELGGTATIKQLSKETGRAESRIKDILNGRAKSEQKRHGLLAKCSALTVDYETVTERGPLVGESKSYRRNVYTLEPGFKLMNGKAELITVIDGSEHLDVARRSSDAQVDASIINDGSKVDVLDVVNKDEEEKITIPAQGESESPSCSPESYVKHVNVTTDNEQQNVGPTSTHTSKCLTIMKPKIERTIFDREQTHLKVTA